MQIQIFPFTDKTAKEAESLAKKLGYGESYAYADYNELPMLQCVPDQAMHVRQYNNGLSEHFIFSSSIGVIAVQKHYEP